MALCVEGGLVVHLVYKKYETQPSAYSSTLVLLVVTPALSSTLLFAHYESVIHACFHGFSLFYATLISSIIAYRLGPWHPLYKFPGPKLARISKWWSVYAVKAGKHHILAKEMHAKYGDWVRVGPNEISVIDTSILFQALGQDGMPRGPMWDSRRSPDGPPHLLAARFVHEHAEKRKFWSRAFSTSAVKEYGATISKRVTQLVNELYVAVKQNEGKSVELQKWFSYFAFDFMGDMAFGGGFELMHEGDVGKIWKQLDLRVAYYSNMAWQHQIPWATRLLLKIPAISASVVNFRKFTYECTRRRAIKGSSIKDLFYHLNNEDGKRSNPPLDELVAEGEVAIVAGSDTTATTLSGVFYYLLSDPTLSSYKRLQLEIDDTFPPGVEDDTVLDHGKLAELPYLNAVINEALRLQPAIPTMLQRAPEKGSGGKWLGSQFIPEGTAVNFPIYVLHRDARNFAPTPDEFWPDRWLHAATQSKSNSNFDPEKIDKAEKSSLVHDLAAFIPFSCGPAQCAGKNLALTEMRAVTASLIHHFEMQLELELDARKDYEGALQDVFLLKVGKLPVTLRPRI